MTTANLLDKNLAYDVLEAALSTGGDFAEIFVENTKRNSISLINGKTDKTLSGIDSGIGIRIFKGFGAIYAYTNNLERESLLRVAKEAAAAAKNNNRVQVMDFTHLEFENRIPALIDPGTVSKKDIVDMLKKISEVSFGFNELVTQTSGTYADVLQNVLIVNSDGLWAEDKRVLTRISASAVASKGNEKQTGSYTIGGRKGQEILKEVDTAVFGKESAQTAVTMINAGLCPSGKMPVIIDNGFGGVIFHEACGHSLEATSVAKGNSEFCGKLGQKIASDKVTAIDDGTIPGAWGSLNIDDEGTPAQKNVLIENGVLKSYMVDKLNGNKMGAAATGSSRRESYKYAPTSRMTNTYIANGNDKQEDIISSTEYGLYAKKMGGGSVQPSTGEFNFAVKEAYLIERGKITKPVRGATLIGKGSEVLLNIDMVSDNMTMETGMCGSISGSVPTNVGQPMIRVQNITVGGRA